MYPIDLPPLAVPAALDGLAASTAALLATVEDLDDAAIQAPCGLDGWTRADVVAHLADGARVSVQITDDALAGRPVTVPAGGPARQDAAGATHAGATHAGATHGDRTDAAALRTRLGDACAALAERWAGLDDDDWSLRAEDRRLGRVPLSRYVVLRWTEVEVHHGDLKVGTGDALAGPAAWSDAFVSVALPLRVAWLAADRRRPASDHGVGGRWRLRATDTGRAWVVAAAGRDAAVTGQPAAADAELAGTSRQLLALLLGRVDPDALTISGDRALARRFVRAFPGP